MAQVHVLRLRVHGVLQHGLERQMLLLGTGLDIGLLGFMYGVLTMAGPVICMGLEGTLPRNAVVLLCEDTQPPPRLCFTSFVAVGSHLFGKRTTQESSTWKAK